MLSFWSCQDSKCFINVRVGAGESRALLQCVPCESANEATGEQPSEPLPEQSWLRKQLYRSVQQKTSFTLWLWICQWVSRFKSSHSQYSPENVSNTFVASWFEERYHIEYFSAFTLNYHLIVDSYTYCWCLLDYPLVLNCYLILWNLVLFFLQFQVHNRLKILAW